jgi:hypothetical protein
LSKSIPRGIRRLRIVSFIRVIFYFYVIVVRQKLNTLKLNVFALCATGVCLAIICILPAQYSCGFRATVPKNSNLVLEKHQLVGLSNVDSVFFYFQWVRTE